jgi:hypothetical protein
VAGGDAAINRIIANYACGHCNSITSPRTDAEGTRHLTIEHDDGCPVLSGALSSIPDTVRALVPDTFRA